MPPSLSMSSALEPSPFSAKHIIGATIMFGVWIILKYIDNSLDFLKILYIPYSVLGIYRTPLAPWHVKRISCQMSYQDCVYFKLFYFSCQTDSLLHFQYKLIIQNTHTKKNDSLQFWPLNEVIILVWVKQLDFFFLSASGPGLCMISQTCKC